MFCMPVEAKHLNVNTTRKQRKNFQFIRPIWNKSGVVIHAKTDLNKQK